MGNQCTKIDSKTYDVCFIQIRRKYACLECTLSVISKGNVLVGQDLFNSNMFRLKSVFPLPILIPGMYPWMPLFISLFNSLYTHLTASITCTENGSTESQSEFSDVYSENIPSTYTSPFRATSTQTPSWIKTHNTKIRFNIFTRWVLTTFCHVLFTIYSKKSFG